MATHEIGLSIKMADKLWILQNKSIHAGSPKELIENNTISQVFNSDLIQFNTENATFEYK
jgi:ABC-type cobalamin/Fe3+-siderophores transport system ATPase subunit